MNVSVAFLNKHQNLKIIFIDNGGYDNSPSLGDKFCKNDIYVTAMHVYFVIV